MAALAGDMERPRLATEGREKVAERWLEMADAGS